MTGFEEFGIKGVSAVGPDVQRVNCPQCSRTSRTPTTCLTVWVKDGTFSCNKCGWGKGLRVGAKSYQHEFKAIETKKEFKDVSAKQVSWLESRGITKTVADRNKVRQAKVFVPQVNEERTCIAFPYYVGETLVNVKYRDKDKNFTQEKGGGRSFFKLNDLAESADCIICEGELDALSFEVAGFTFAVSVPDGAPQEGAKNLTTKLAFLDNCSRYLQHIERFYLATDTDKPGLTLREELARRLDKEKCYIVNFPAGCKDANDVLCKHGAEVLKRCIDQATPYPIEGAIEARDRFEFLRDLHENGFPESVKTGFDCFDQHYSMHPGHLTVVTGIPGHGKSNFIDQIAVKLAENAEWRGAFFTPENYPIEIHQMRIAEILMGKPFLPNYNNSMSSVDLALAEEFIQEYIHYIQPSDERYTLDAILDIASYWVRTRGIKYLVLDPWNTIEHHRPSHQTEGEYTALTLNRIKYFARSKGIHVIIVAHPFKMQKLSGGLNYEIPNLYSISGSANWYNIVDNGLCVYRYFHDDESSTTQVYIQKVKHKFIGRLGMVMFRFEKGNQRYDELSEARPNQVHNNQLQHDINW